MKFLDTVESPRTDFVLRDFTKITNLLADQLENRFVHIHEDQILDCPAFQQKVNAIKNSDRRKGRTDAMIERNNMSGALGEYAIAKMLGVKTLDQLHIGEKFDKKDPANYGKDLTYEGFNIEVKTHKTFTSMTMTESSFNPLWRIYELKEHHDIFDVIIFAHIEETSTSRLWTVTPTLLVNPFPDWSKTRIIDWDHCFDTRNDGTMKIYDYQSCLPDGICYPLNADIKVKKPVEVVYKKRSVVGEERTQI